MLTSTQDFLGAGRDTEACLCQERDESDLRLAMVAMVGKKLRQTVYRKTQFRCWAGNEHCKTMDKLCRGLREGFIKKKKSGYFPDWGGGVGPHSRFFFFRREMLKSVYDGLIHPEN